MSISKRGEIWQYNFSVNGKRYIKSCKTKNKKVALDIESKARLEVIKQDELGVKKHIKFYEALDIVLRDNLERDYQSPTPSIIKNLKIYMHDRPLHKIKNSDLYDLSDKLKAKTWKVGKTGKERKLKTSTISNYFGIIRQTNDAAKVRGYLINYDLVMPVKPPKSERVRIMTQQQRQELLQLMHPNRQDGAYLLKSTGKKYQQRVDNYDFIVMLMNTGCRYTEIAKLTWNDVDIKKGLIKVWRGKTKSETHLRMTDDVIRTLNKRQAAPQHAKYIFTDFTGSSHRKYSSLAIIRTIKSIVGLEDFTLHDLRHCCASELASAGMNLSEIAVILGHTSLSTTQKYAHLKTEDVQEKALLILNNMGNAVVDKNLVS